ncbi:protein of unknown function [Pararobbsia alpina]
MAPPSISTIRKASPRRSCPDQCVPAGITCSQTIRSSMVGTLRTRTAASSASREGSEDEAAEPVDDAEGNEADSTTSSADEGVDEGEDGGMAAPIRKDWTDERAIERYRNLPGFYPSVEPRHWQDRMALGPDIAARATGTLAVLR